VRLLEKVTNRRTAITLAVVAVVTGAVVACGSGDSDGEGQSESVRSSFSHCVDTYNLSLSPETRAATLAQADSVIDGALNVVAADPRYGSQPDVIIDQGCPVPPAPSVSPPGAWRDGGAIGPFPTVAPGQSVSPYFVHVFVLDLTTMESLLGSTEQRVQPQEIRCGGDDCQVVTYAVYVTEQEVANDADLVTRLVEVVHGLRARFKVGP